jgi:hypothetical protein
MLNSLCILFMYSFKLFLSCMKYILCVFSVELACSIKYLGVNKVRYRNLQNYDTAVIL